MTKAKNYPSEEMCDDDWKIEMAADLDLEDLYEVPAWIAELIDKLIDAGWKKAESQSTPKAEEELMADNSAPVEPPPKESDGSKEPK